MKVKQRWTQEEVDRVKKLKADGRTLREIALILERSFETVKSKLYGNYERSYANPVKAALANKRAREWHQNNKEKSLKNKKIWYKNNKEYHRELVYGSDFRTNKEQYNKYQKEWTKLNPEKRRAADHRWDKRHPEQRGEINDRRRVRLGNLIGSCTTSEWDDRIKEFNNKCAYCQKDFDGDITRDHVIPISILPIGFIWNLAPVCSSCNSAKCNMNVLEFLEAKGYSISDLLAQTLDRCFNEYENL